MAKGDYSRFHIFFLSYIYWMEYFFFIFNGLDLFFYICFPCGCRGWGRHFFGNENISLFVFYYLLVWVSTTSSKRYSRQGQNQTWSKEYCRLATKTGVYTVYSKLKLYIPNIILIIKNTGICHSIIPKEAVKYNFLVKNLKEG